MKRAIVTGGTKSDVAPIAVFAINIRNTNAELFDELVVYHDGFKAKDMRLINDIFPTKFIKYEYPNKSKNDEVLSYFSKMLFCKYECFALLKDYDEVVWSDYDVVIQGSLKEICNASGRCINVLSCNDKLSSMFYKKITNEEILNYNLQCDGIPTPIFTISSDLSDYEKIHLWCYEKTKQYDEDIYYPEQCIFSLAIQEFNIDCKKYPFEIYACHPNNAVGDEIILHASGPVKFWNGLYNECWQSMYGEWRKMGGSSYKEWKKKLQRKLIFMRTRLMGIRDKEHD